MVFLKKRFRAFKLCLNGLVTRFKKKVYIKNNYLYLHLIHILARKSRNKKQGGTEVLP